MQDNEVDCTGKSDWCTMEASVSPHIPIKRRHFLGNNPKALATIFFRIWSFKDWLLIHLSLVSCQAKSAAYCLRWKLIFSLEKQVGSQPLPRGYEGSWKLENVFLGNQVCNIVVQRWQCWLASFKLDGVSLLFQIRDPCSRSMSGQMMPSGLLNRSPSNGNEMCQPKAQTISHHAMAAAVGGLGLPSPVCVWKRWW